MQVECEHALAQVAQSERYIVDQHNAPLVHPLSRAWHLGGFVAQALCTDACVSDKMAKEIKSGKISLKYKNKCETH